MLAIRWTRRVLDGLLIVAILAVVLIGALTLASQAFSGRALVITGGSMEPTIPLGAFVLTLPEPSSEYRVGDIVTVAQTGRTPYTHRITRTMTLPPSAGVVGGIYIETKGDANARPEPVVVNVADVVGRVAIAIPFLGLLAATLSAPVGVLGFLAVCITMVAGASSCEELEERLLARRRQARLAAAADEARAADARPAIEARLTVVSAADPDEQADATGLASEDADRAGSVLFTAPSEDDDAATADDAAVGRAGHADARIRALATLPEPDGRPAPDSSEVDAA